MKDPQLTWERLAWLREQTKLPIWLKGILREEDVLRACERGYDGVVLSNHGGRQLDTALHHSRSCRRHGRPWTGLATRSHS
mgnify:CR=1 FL=1